MKSCFLFIGLGLMFLGGLAACSATNHPNGQSPGGGGAGGSDGGSGGGDGGLSGAAGAGAGPTTGGGTTDIPIPTTLVCPSVPQDILILDFRSGWWSGGGGGQFGPTPLQAMAQT